jgi:hypothetical protein
VWVSGCWWGGGGGGGGRGGIADLRLVPKLRITSLLFSPRGAILHSSIHLQVVVLNEAQTKCSWHGTLLSTETTLPYAQHLSREKCVYSFPFGCGN